MEATMDVIAGGIIGAAILFVVAAILLGALRWVERHY